MSEASNIRAIQDLIQKMAGTYNKDIVSLILCNVDKVNDFTIDCTPISGQATTPIPGVKLNSEANDGFMIVPKVGSTVLVATSSRNDYFTIMYSDIDKVVCVIDNSNSYEFSSSGFVWNGGNFGGMAKTGIISTKLDTLEAEINNLKAVIAAIITAGTSLPMVPVLQGTLAAFFSGYNIVPLIPTTQIEISDNKIKH
jgi:hypothetical protein